MRTTGVATRGLLGDHFKLLPCGFAGGQEGREDAPLQLSGDEGLERGRVTAPLTAGPRQRCPAALVRLDRSPSHQQWNNAGITPRGGTRFCLREGHIRVTWGLLQVTLNVVLPAAPAAPGGPLRIADAGIFEVPPFHAAFREEAARLRTSRLSRTVATGGTAARRVGAAA
jgi:hypothetical protein